MTQLQSEYKPAKASQAAALALLGVHLAQSPAPRAHRHFRTCQNLFHEVFSTWTADLWWQCSPAQAITVVMLPHEPVGSGMSIQHFSPVHNATGLLT